MPPISRRALLTAASAIARGAEQAVFADYTDAFRVEAQPADPRVKCFDWRRLASWKTPASEFFIFHRSRAARLDAARWRLRIGGLVARPRTLTLEQLRARADVRTVSAVIECSGNSGNPALMNGLVGNGEWTGVPLAALLDDCGLRPEAREIVFFGADSITEPKWSAGGREFTAPHGRSVFVQDAMESGAVLAFALNREPLGVEQGFPVRLIVPGWYGMAQIKWLTRIEALDRRYEGQPMSRNYHSLQRLNDGSWLDASITRNRLKSVVARVDRRGALWRVSGAAWGGLSPLRAVEVRIGGGSWRPAALEDPAEPHAWRLWSIGWPQLAPGAHEIVSRAINTAAEVQPTSEQWRARFASNREDHSQWVRRIVIPK
jgi:DMSO/TMAO reductase YedYZ molybdopterin-dependent catalytic subunit